MGLKRFLKRVIAAPPDPAAAYKRHLKGMLLRHPDRDDAFAAAIGSADAGAFVEQGDAQVAVLRHHGLAEGMAIYDLGCGCGRTAQALQRAGWTGRYIGADIVADFIEELQRRCPRYEAHVHQQPSLVAADGSLDMVFHWSVFTHISPEECHLYLEDTFRALKPGGKLVFSFLEFADPRQISVFETRLDRLRTGQDLPLPDTFLHRDWIALWAARTGFEQVRFTDGDDATNHPEIWQTLVSMIKPAGA